MTVALVRGCSTTWWQVLGSNQRRLSRRFTDPWRKRCDLHERLRGPLFRHTFGMIFALEPWAPAPETAPWPRYQSGGEVSMDRTRVRIRPYRPSDFGALYRICLLTDADGQDASSLYCHSRPIASHHGQLRDRLRLRPDERCYAWDSSRSVCIE